MKGNSGSQFITELTSAGNNASSNNNSSNPGKNGSNATAKNSSSPASSSGSSGGNGGSPQNKSPPPLNICIVINLLHYITPLSRLILLSEPLDNNHYGLYHTFAPSTTPGSSKSQHHIGYSGYVGISELERQSFVCLRVILSQLSSGRNEPINIYPFLDKFCLYTRSSFQSFDELDVSFVWDQIVRLITTAVPTLTHIFHGNILFTKPATEPNSKTSDGSVVETKESKKDTGDCEETDYDDLEDIMVSISNLVGFLHENSSPNLCSRCIQANFHSSVESIEDILRYTASTASSYLSSESTSSADKMDRDLKFVDTSKFTTQERVAYNNAKILLNEPNILVFVVDSPCLPPMSLQTKSGKDSIL